MFLKQAMEQQERRYLASWALGTFQAMRHYLDSHKATDTLLPIYLRLDDVRMGVCVTSVLSEVVSRCSWCRGTMDVAPGVSLGCLGLCVHRSIYKNVFTTH